MDYNQQILNAKRKWEEAYALGDEAGMNSAHQEAENAREKARTSGEFDSIFDYLQDGNTSDYNSAVDRYNEDYSSRYPDQGGLGPYQKIEQKMRPKPIPPNVTERPQLGDSDYLEKMVSYTANQPQQNYSEPQLYDDNYPEQNYYSDKKADTVDNWVDYYANNKPESRQEEEEQVSNIVDDVVEAIGDALGWIGDTFWPSPDKLKK